ncbi:MAG: hypothetical protein A3J83_02840 [Elusimicrobia bacterium RIFOXYA2_FULL_40_6]|nr:MAG: hypothetical protein A3J83_02840 [Elusimicrobia bacterium RIFOXYA2_FULL_40_6]
MSLMGLDIGTTGCKATVMSVNGDVLAQSYREYNLLSLQKGYFELDSKEVWKKIKEIIKDVASQTKKDPIKAFSVSSFGEGVTPVSKDREILGNCIVCFDPRGQKEALKMEKKISPKELYNINGNIMGHMYSAPKIMWLKYHEQKVYDKAFKFLLMEDFVFFMMGCEAVTDYSMADRTLLFDIKSGDWSDKLLKVSGIDKSKLSKAMPSGTKIGSISDSIAQELGLPKCVEAVTGGHDQCCTALGAGIIKEGMAAYGIGTVICITVAYSKMPDKKIMFKNNLNIEHHTAPGLFVSLLYNYTGGSGLKWFRDTFGAEEKRIAKETGRDVYDVMLENLPSGPTDILTLPHFVSTGPPLFESRSKGVIAGLTLDTKKEEILKSVLEGVTYYFKEGVDYMNNAGIKIKEFRATGGGAKSKKWLQIKADIFGVPFVTLKVNEAGSIGTAILAGTGIGEYSNIKEAVETLVKTGKTIYPNKENHKKYIEKVELYKQMFPAMKNILHKI